LKAGVLVQRSLNLSGIVSKDLEEYDTNSEGTEGLFWLNMLIAEKSATGILLPYFGHIDITPVEGQEVYFIPNLITAEILTFTIQGVRYSITVTPRYKYLGTPRADNISSLPFQWYWERVNGGMNIYLYFKPSNQIEELKVTGLLGLQDVIFSTELDDFIDLFYQNFLMFENSESLCIAYNLSVPPDTASKLKRLRNEMRSINPRDFSIKKKSLIGGGGLLTYGQVNFGRAWTP
jgi:hypothetical protein